MENVEMIIELLEEAIENGDWNKVEEALNILSIDEDELYGYKDD